MKSPQSVSIKLLTTEHENLARIAKENNQSVNDIMSEAVSQFLKKRGLRAARSNDMKKTRTKNLRTKGP